MINEYEVYDLVRELYYLENKEDITREEADELDERRLEEWLYDRFEFGNWDDFVSFIDKLIELVPPIQTSFTGTRYYAFISNNLMICRKKYGQESN